ncbi:MAG: hypothetical protein LC667_01205 [Thioalkalivibrio sp.]|nr:hypothetical protein [Thioalkalivibrio sp.]
MEAEDIIAAIRADAESRMRAGVKSDPSQLIEQRPRSGEEKTSQLIEQITPMPAKKKAKAPSGHSRAAQNKKIRRDALREELQAREYLRQLSTIERRLDPDASIAALFGTAAVGGSRLP